MKEDRMQQTRFELKYLLKESVAERVREFARCHLDLDPFGAGLPDYSYPVHSIYLDSDRLEIYWRTVNGDKNRFKLRLRYYNDKANTPVFFEIKRRVDNAILKQRAGVKRSAAALLLRGHYPGPDDLCGDGADSLAAAQRFVRLMTEMEATPRSHISYRREAYISQDDHLRVTMDRDILSEPRLVPEIRVNMDKPVRSFEGLVILELKFTERFPNWFRELVRMANAMQSGAAKYVSGVAGLGHRRVGARHAEVLEEESLLSNFRPGDDLPASVRQELGEANRRKT
jgi:hypothetical protein